MHDEEVKIERHKKGVHLISTSAWRNRAQASTGNCKRFIKKFEGCLKDGYKSNGCASGDGKLSKKDSKKCAKFEKKLKKCDHECMKPEPTELPVPQLPYNLDCKRAGFDFWGADIRNFQAASFEDCAMVCSQEVGCKSITVRNSDINCWLKNKNSGDTGPVINAALTSMNMECDLSGVDSSCKRENYDFWGADLRNFNSQSFDDCARHCRDTADCQSFTLRKSDNYCWLKRKRGGEIGPSPNDALISMNIDCVPSQGLQASDKSCAMDGYDFWGADLRDFDSDSYEACTTACSDAADCKSITLRKSDNHCWLKTKVGGETGPVPNGALISRNMECDTSQLDLSCARDNKDFWGADLRSFDSESLDECARAMSMQDGTGLSVVYPQEVGQLLLAEEEERRTEWTGS